MEKAWENIKKRWEENPIQVIVVGALAATSAAKLMEAYGAMQSRRAYAKQVKRQRRGEI